MDTFKRSLVHDWLVDNDDNQPSGAWGRWRKQTLKQAAGADVYLKFLLDDDLITTPNFLDEASVPSPDTDALYPNPQTQTVFICPAVAVMGTRCYSNLSVERDV